MKIFCVTIVLGIAAILPECIHKTDQRITEGVYREPSKVEAVIVKGQEMTLQLNVTKGPQLGVVSGRYKYHVLTNRELSFTASSNDAFFVFTVLGNDWIWDGRDIIRKHRETGETVVFARDAEEQ